jgi:hypothetical protein
MLRDVTSTFNAWFHNAEMVRDVYAQTNNVIPVNSIELTLPRAIFSVTRDVNVTEDIRVQGVLDLEFTFDGKRNTIIRTDLVSFDPRLGLEVGYKNLVFFRAGEVMSKK